MSKALLKSQATRRTQLGSWILMEPYKRSKYTPAKRAGVKYRHPRIGMKKLSARWTPYFYKVELKRAPVQLPQACLGRLQILSIYYLRWIINPRSEQLSSS